MASSEQICDELISHLPSNICPPKFEVLTFEEEDFITSSLASILTRTQFCWDTKEFLLDLWSDGNLGVKPDAPDDNHYAQYIRYTVNGDTVEMIHIDRDVFETAKDLPSGMRAQHLLTRFLHEAVHRVRRWQHADKTKPGYRTAAQFRDEFLSCINNSYRYYHP